MIPIPLHSRKDKTRLCKQIKDKNKEIQRNCQSQEEPKET